MLVPGAAFRLSARHLTGIPIHALLSSPEKDDVIVKGWVRRVQKMKKVWFVNIEDGLSPFSVQAVVPRSLCASVPVGSAVEVEGRWRGNEGSQQTEGSQQMELSATACRVSAVDENPRYDGMSLDALRVDLPLRAKSSPVAALLRLRSAFYAQTHSFFLEREFVHVDPPIITSNDCEGAGETFQVKGDGSGDFFGHPVYLTVSSQLHLEALCNGLSRVYTVNRAFRAEKNQSSTHISEFTMIEAEVAFCEELDSLMCLVEGYMRSLFDCCQSLSAEVHALATTSKNKRLTLLDAPFPRISFKEACRLATERGSSLSTTGSLTKSAELSIAEYFGSPVFVTNFPVEQKPFYTRVADDGMTESFDLLCPMVGEVVGGSLRAVSPFDLRGKGDLPPSLEWYSRIRRRGKPPSGGFGIGFERIIQAFLGIPNIKDATPFPRWYQHCSC